MAEFGKALSKGLEILEALHAAEAPLTFAALRHSVDVAPASFTRFLKILAARGYAARAADGRYRLGWRLAQLGQAALERRPLQVAAQPHLQELVDKTGEAAEVVEFDDDGFLFLARQESPKAVVLKARPGSRFGFSDNNAMGRLGLAFSTGKESGRALPAATAAAVRAAGFAEMLQNNREVYRAAAAVNAHPGECCGCLVIAAPAFRVGSRKRAGFKRLLLKHAREVSVALGCSR